MLSGRASYQFGGAVLAGVLAVLAVAVKLVGCTVVLGPVRVGWYLPALGAILALVGAAALAAPTWLQVVGLTMLVPAVPLAGLAMGGLALAGFGAVPMPVQRTAAPEWPRRELVIREWLDVIDPMYDLSVETPGVIGLGWPVGCVNGDYQSLLDARWLAAGELAVTVDSGDGPEVVTVMVDRVTGKVAGVVPEVLRHC
jgi:hypothetical protein